MKKTSVLIISNDGRANKKIQIPTLFISHWKHVFLGVFLFLILSVSCVIYIFNRQSTQRYTEAYVEKINKLKEKNRQLSMDDASNQLNIIEVKKAMNAVDSTLNRINDKMRKRGLKPVALKNVGGPVEGDNENLEELAIYYARTLKDLERRLDGAPLGRPHHGKVTSRFGYRANPFTGRGREMHSGIDIKGRIGESVKSTARGTVTHAGYMGNYGYVVMVSHANGYETRYAHLSRVRVKKGQKIDVGTIIGLLGNTGRSTGPHLHYEVLQNGNKLNPERFTQL